MTKYQGRTPHLGFESKISHYLYDFPKVLLKPSTIPFLPRNCPRMDFNPNIFPSTKTVQSTRRRSTLQSLYLSIYWEFDKSLNREVVEGNFFYNIGPLVLDQNPMGRPSKSSPKMAADKNLVKKQAVLSRPLFCCEIISQFRTDLILVIHIRLVVLIKRYIFYFYTLDKLYLQKKLCFLQNRPLQRFTTMTAGPN